MASNFAFLRARFPELAELGMLAERYLHSDPQSCLMKTGLLCEGMIRVMCAQDHIPLPERCDAATRIAILQQRDVLPSDVAAAFHLLRKERNRAAHEGGPFSPEKTRVLLQIAHSLCGWFSQTYGDETSRPEAFVAPAATDDARQEDGGKAGQDAELAEQAVAHAARNAAEPEDVRRRRAAAAAGARRISEAETRYLIDEQLRKVGWEADSESLRYALGARPQAGRNLAIAEWPTDAEAGGRGYADYALFVGTRLVGIIEAKARHKDIPAVLDHQCKDYARHIRAEHAAHVIGEWRGFRVPFLFAANGRPYIRQYAETSGIWFQDVRQAAGVPRALHGWMSPAGLEALLTRDDERGNQRLAALPADFLTDKDGLNLREYQLRAIAAAERAVMEGAQALLLAMATGTGKTRTVLGLMYRFLKSGRFRRILFLVDRTALGTQALDVFKDVKLEELQSLSGIYSICGLTDTGIDTETRVHVATVQSMVRRILYGEGSDSMPSVSDYDLVIVDEAHRGYILDREMTDGEQLYRDQRDYQSKYREVIDYFQAVKIGLTATPALQTTQIFGPPVFTYSYREAVIDGFLADYDAPHQLSTRLSEQGIHYKPGDTVALFDPATGEITNAALLDDELDFEVDEFNRTVINENFNREILQEIAKGIDPEDASSGKTLIYAVNDRHADMIVRILKEIYAEELVDTDAVMKITGSIGNRKNIDAAIRRFRNESFPSIAVTVDLLTTGIDVPEITRLVFLRRVKSRILFEQMLGRATRLCPAIGKTHFEVYDAVGQFSALEPLTSMRPVVSNPSASLDLLLDGLEVMDEPEHIQSQVSQILGLLQRRRRRLPEEARQQFADLCGDTPESLIRRVRTAQPREARELLLARRDALALLRASDGTGSRPIVLSDTPDALTSHTQGYGKDHLRPADYLESFARFVREHRDEIAAMNLICTRPADLTRESLKSLRLTLGREGFTVRQLNSALSRMSNTDIAADIIGLVRCYGVNAELLGHEERVRRAVARLKQAHEFSAAEKKWIDRMEKYLLNESVLSVRTFDESVVFRDRGGFAALNKLFRNELENLVNELNAYLYDDGGLAA